MDRDLLKFIMSEMGQHDNIHHRMLTLFLQTSDNPEVSFDEFEKFLIKYKSSELLLTREELLTENNQTDLTIDQRLFNQYIISTIQISAAAPSEFQAVHPSEMDTLSLNQPSTFIYSEQQQSETNTPPTKRQRYTGDIALHSEFHEGGEVQIQQVYNEETSNPQKKRAHISGKQEIEFAYPSGNYSLYEDYKKGIVTRVKDGKYEITKEGSTGKGRRSYIERHGKKEQVVLTANALSRIKYKEQRENAEIENSQEKNTHIVCEQQIEFADPSGNYSSYNDYKFKHKITPITDRSYKIIREGSTGSGRRLYIERHGKKEQIVHTITARNRLLAKGLLQLHHPCDSAPTQLPTNDLDTTASNSGVPDYQSFNYDDENKAPMPAVENFHPAPSGLEPYPENDDNALRDVFSYPFEEDIASNPQKKRAHISDEQKIDFAYPSGNYSLFKDYKKGKVTPVTDGQYEIIKEGSTGSGRRLYIERHGKKVQVVLTANAFHRIEYKEQRENEEIEYSQEKYTHISCEQKIEFTDPCGNYSSYNDYRFKNKISPITDRPYKIIREGSAGNGRQLYIERNGEKERIVLTSNARSRLLPEGQLQLHHPCDSAPTQLPTNHLNTTAPITNPGISLNAFHQSFNYEDESLATPAEENIDSVSSVREHVLTNTDDSYPLPTDENEDPFDPFSDVNEDSFGPFNECDELSFDEDTAATSAIENLPSVSSGFEPNPDKENEYSSNLSNERDDLSLGGDTAGWVRTNRFFSDKPENPNTDKTKLPESTKGFK